jgi:hypothetical protein
VSAFSASSRVRACSRWAASGKTAAASRALRVRKTTIGRNLARRYALPRNPWRRSSSVPSVACMEVAPGYQQE